DQPPVTLQYVDSPFGNIGDASTYLARAELMFDLDRFDEARDELGGALSNDPAHVPSLTLLAILELQVGNYDDALTAASAALAAEPTHETAVLARAHALALLHRTDEALAAAGEIQQRYPESWWHNVHYALVVREARNGQDALDAAWAAVRLAPEEARAHLALAMVAATLQLNDLAERALAAAARFDPDVDTALDGELGPGLLRGTPNSAPRNRPRRDSDLAAGRPQRGPLPWQLQRALRIAAAIGIAVPVIAALMSGGQPDGARLIAGIGAVAGIIGLVMMLKKLPGDLRDALRVMIDQDKLLGAAVVAAGCGPVLAGVFAVTGMVFALGLAVIAGMVTIGITLLHGRN
ncbi:MAG: tetratricopeptide repeat protein, partial [Stackebrandtia sp.]